MLNDQLANLADQRARIVSVDLSPGNVATPATLPVPSSHDGAVMYLLAAGLSGMLLGAILAFLRELGDRRIRSVEQAAEVTGLPLLGTVRHRKRRGGHGAEADVRYLAMAVDEWTRDAPGAPIVLLSPRAGEGRTALVAGLARALAGAGRGVFVGAPPEGMDRLVELVPTGKRIKASTVGAPAKAEPSVPAAPAAPAAARPPRPPRPSPAAPANAEVNGQHPVEPAAEEEEASAQTSRIEDTVVLPRVRLPGDENPGGRQGGVVMAGGVSTMVGATASPETTQKIETAVATAVQTRVDRVTVAPGEIALGPFEMRPNADVLLLDGPPAETDERGVRAAADGVSVLVVARDRTRVGELSRLVERVKTRGSAPVGFIVTGVGHG